MTIQGLSCLPQSELAIGQSIAVEKLESKSRISAVSLTDQPNVKKASSKSNWSVLFQSKFIYSISDVLYVCRSVIVVANRIFAGIRESLYNRTFQAVKILRLTKLFDVALVPFTLSSMATHIHHFIHGNRRSRVDSALHIFSETGSLGSSITSFAMGLVHVGVLSGKALSWINPVYIASSVLSVVAVPIYLRSIVKMRRLEHEFDKITHLSPASHEANLDDFHTALKFIKDKNAHDENFISNVFSCSEEKLINSLMLIEKRATEKLSSSDSEEHIQGRRLLNKALCDIRKRFHHVKVNSALSATAAVVSCIGAVALLFSPAAPVAYGCIAMGVGLNIGNFVYQKVKEYRFTHDVGMRKKWHEWIS